MAPPRATAPLRAPPPMALPLPALAPLPPLSSLPPILPPFLLRFGPLPPRIRQQWRLPSTDLLPAAHGTSISPFSTATSHLLPPPPHRRTRLAEHLTRRIRPHTPLPSDPSSHSSRSEPPPTRSLEPPPKLQQIYLSHRWPSTSGLSSPHGLHDPPLPRIRSLFSQTRPTNLNPTLYLNPTR